MKQVKIIRAATVPQSVKGFCGGLLRELREEEGYEVVALSSPGEALDAVAQSDGVRAVAVPMERRMSPFKDLRSLWRLVRVFRKERPTMVHSMTPKAGLLCMMAAWMCRVPVRVHTFTGLVFPTAKGLTQKILIFTDRMTCRCATHVIPEGEGVKNDLTNYRITRKPLRVLGHGNVRGIDLERFDPEREDVRTEASRLRRDGVFTFIFIGRIAGDKGVNELVEAFARLHAERPDTRLVIVGPDESAIDPIRPETAEAMAAGDGIEAVGSQADVRPWLVASDALVLPSYREGFPNVVIEAGAMGLPSIVTDINGAREIIRHGENGVIVPPRDADALYRAMADFVVDSAATRRMAEAARPLIADRYEQSYVRRCLKDFYREILPK